ncbi:cyclic nucleotide-binding domain-containing protein [Magnetospirillum sp. J10]|uniref:Cyclic nucleotide-binding domain-containing protein n=2 Tax=Magnetospirillum sulfuroxidans TaxID=611300 RepID=A0ABS5IBR1_9PROT|nr:cyclic nucleotide-binding domain-containing protein [Magnetospirillum sulfuroxidans]
MAPRRARFYRMILTSAILLFTARTALDTLPAVWGDADGSVRILARLCLMLLAGDYALRGMVAAAAERPWSGLAAYAFSPYGVFDCIAVIPVLAGALFGWPSDVETAFGILGFLKLARYSPALETLGAVLLAEVRPLASSLFIMALLVLFTSALLYFVERDINPGMASIPQAMWWSVVTLATLGYGDVVPISPLGKVLGAGVGILGLGMFALPASILASGFTEEMRRQNFVSTWHLVAKVPFFARLQATEIAQVAALLKVQRVMRGETLMRSGDDGDSMYFLVSGQVEVTGRAGAFVLKAGDFFGEIALLESRPRMATVRAVTRCQLLVLDARDFHQFTAHSPEILATIRETAQSRLSAADPGENG